jgi:hypothetical protein
VNRKRSIFLIKFIDSDETGKINFCLIFLVPFPEEEGPLWLDFELLQLQSMKLLAVFKLIMELELEDLRSKICWLWRFLMAIHEDEIE